MFLVHEGRELTFSACRKFYVDLLISDNGDLTPKDTIGSREVARQVSCIDLDGCWVFVCGVTVEGFGSWDYSKEEAKDVEDRTSLSQ